MDEQESYLNEEEVNQSLNNAGNKINQFGQGMYNGVRQGINDYKSIKNHGLQSADKDLNDNKKEPEIPEPKNQNTNPTGVVNPSTGNDNQNSLPNKDNDLKDKDKDKKDDQNSDKKDDDKDDKKKKEKKSNQKSKKSGIINGDTKQSIKDIIKSKQSIAIIVLIGFCIVLFVVSALIGASSLHVIYHNITEDFLCSGEDVLSDEYKNAKNTFGWRLKETGEYETTEVPKTTFIEITSPTGGVMKIPTIEMVKEQSPIYEAVFSTGVDIELQEGTEIYAVQPGVITKITNDYIEISHNSNDENDYNNKNYITRYYNYGTLEDDLQEEDAVVKGTLLSTFVSGTFHFELLEDDKNVDSNILFGYPSANAVCGNKDSIKTTRGTLENEDIKLLYDNKCDGKVEYLGVSTAKDMMCNGYNSGIFSDELVNYEGYLARENAPTRTNSFYYEQNSNNYGKYLEGECAMYATCRAQEILSTMGINKSFTTNVNGGEFCSSVQGFSKGMSPRQGSLVSWSGGEEGYGHVAVVEKVNADGSIVISEMYAKLGFYGASSWDIIDNSPNKQEARKYNCTANGSGCWQTRTIPANRINDAGWGSSFRLNCFIYLLGD